MCKELRGADMSCKKIITITRQYGSGGHDIGKLLAQKLDIPFYDKELISLAAKESGVSPEVFAQADEKRSNSLLYSLSTGLYTYGNGYSTMGDLPMNDRLYILQHKIIKEKDAPWSVRTLSRQEPVRQWQRLTKTEPTTTVFIQDKNGALPKTMTCASTARGSVRSRQPI